MVALLCGEFKEKLSGECVSERDQCTWGRIQVHAREKDSLEDKCQCPEAEAGLQSSGTVTGLQLQQREPGKRGLGGEAGEVAMSTVIRGIKARRWTSDAILGKAGC